MLYLEKIHAVAPFSLPSLTPQNGAIRSWYRLGTELVRRGYGEGLVVVGLNPCP